MRQEIFDLYVFEPVKVNNELYGKSIHFNHPKKTIKFTSKFHKPTFVKYDEIEEITIYYDRKRVLLVLGLLTVFVFVGIFILFFRTHLPPWRISIKLKNQSKPIVIRARLHDGEAAEMADFCTLKIPTKFIIPDKKANA